MSVAERLAKARERLDAKRAAKFLGVSEKTLANWRYTRLVDLPFIKVGWRVQYELADLERFLEDRKTRP